MQQRQDFREGQSRWSKWETWVLAVLILAIALIVTLWAAYGTRQYAAAQTMLTKAKTVRLAVMSVAAQCSVSDAPFASPGGEGGFAPGVAQEIISLADVSGEVWLVQTDGGYGVVRLIYREQGYTAEYDAQKGGWEVYENRRLI